MQLRTDREDLGLVSRVIDSLSLKQAVDTLISDLSGKVIIMLLLMLCSHFHLFTIS